MDGSPIGWKYLPSPQSGRIAQRVEIVSPQSGWITIGQVHYQDHDGFQGYFLLLMGTVPFGRLLLPFNGWNRPLRSHITGLLSFCSLWFDQRPPLTIVHLYKEEQMKLLTKKAKRQYCKIRLTKLHLWIIALYLTASGVGSVPSQYQWMVSRFTNFAQVLSSGLVFEKIFSRKLNSSILTCGRRLTAKEMDD